MFGNIAEGVGVTAGLLKNLKHYVKSIMYFENMGEYLLVSFFGMGTHLMYANEIKL